MNPGMVLYWKQFVFENGDPADKLFIVLGHPRNNACLTVKATSQQKWRHRDEGCHIENGYFFVRGGDKERWFDCNTWIILEQPYLFRCDAIKGAIDSGQAVVKTNLIARFMSELRNCLKRSDDISEEQLAHLN